jgi:hypothetical protein
MPAMREAQLPWLDYATMAMPTSHTLILWWAQYLWLTDGNFRTAFQRVGSHFITSIQFPDLEPDEESQFKDLFNKHLNYRRELQSCADEFLCYGNLIVSLYIPFQRFLICRQCGYEQPIRRVRYGIGFDTEGVHWKRTGGGCPMCKDARDYICKDRRDPDISKVRLERYSPFEIDIGFNRHSKRKEIYWRIPNYVREDIRRGAPIHIEDTPMSVLEAVAYDGDVKLDDECVLHMDEPIITGMDTRGWGVPRSISNFRMAWLMQTINRADQAICLDYTLGMRILSPTPAPGQVQDPVQTQGMDRFVRAVRRIVAQHRADPATYHTAPYPLTYQFAGGEGATLIPPDKLKFRHQEYLNSLGIPLEYHSMTLSVQAAPMALQLFESCWQSVPALYNQILAWMIKVCARNFDIDETTAIMQKTTVSYDEGRKQILMQLMSANQISPQTALAAIGINAEEEVKKVFQHQKTVAKEQEKANEQQQEEQEMGAAQQLNQAPGSQALLSQQQQAGQPNAAAAAGGMGGIPGMGSGGQQPTTIQAMADQADQIAQQLVSMPDYDRKQQLRQIRESNQDLHSMVTAKMDKLRQQAASQGQQQVLGQGQQGGQPQ